MNKRFRSRWFVLVSGLAAGLVFSQPVSRVLGPPNRQAEVVTDKGDYAPGTTAYIAASDFLPKETVVLQVLHADGTPDTGEDHEPWSVQANSHGDLVTEWHVCE